MPTRSPRPRFHRQPSSLRAHARESRRAQAPAERRLWAALRAHRSRAHFRRQHPVGNRYVADFFRAEAGLCVEVDGDSHAEPDQASYRERTLVLNELGYRVIRFTNAEVLRNLRAALEAIREAMGEPP